MSGPDLKGLFAKAQEVQQRLAQIQADLARRTVEAQSGAGMVTAVATGQLRILEVRIEDELLAANDKAMVQNLVAAAVNAALAKAQAMVQEEMQRAAGSLQIPGMPGGMPPGAGQ